MPAHPGQAEADLKRRLFEETWEFDFFEAVRLLERWQNRGVTVGHAGPYRSEGIRFRSDPMLSFPASDLGPLEIQTAGEVDPATGHAPAIFRRISGKRPHRGLAGREQTYRIPVYFMGLYGSQAPTPIYLTELINFSDAESVSDLVDFLDIFNHRLVSLYYRAGTKYRYPLRFEPGGEDEISTWLLSFVGLGSPVVNPLAGVPADRLLRYVGLLSLRTRPGAALERVLSDWFDRLPVGVEELILRWVDIPPEQRNRLGSPGANNRLGEDLCVGERLRDLSGKIRIRIGPVGWEEFLRLLPDGEKLRDFSSLARLFVFDSKDYDFKIRILGGEIPEMRLGCDDSAPRLGWTSWLLTAPGLETNPEVVFEKPRPDVRHPSGADSTRR